MRTGIGIVLLSIVTMASAQDLVIPPHPVRQYAVKFVCGKASEAQTARFDFAQGSYYTTINVHNPALSGGLEFRKKFALALPDEKPGRISQWFPVALKADEALQVDCGSIYRHLDITPGTFIDGFAVLQLLSDKPELDVEAVYTASPGNGVSTMTVKHVAGRITQ